MKLVKGAVGEHDVVLDFHLSDGNHPTNGNQMTGANSIRKPKEVLKRHAWIDFSKKIKVQCYSLDKYCILNKIDHIDFMWCDIQGAEYDMILGAREIMAKTKYALLEFSDVELYQGQRSLDDYMELLRKDADWEIVNTYSIDVLIQNKSLLK
jgi:FkbM family methyltransferase